MISLIFFVKDANCIAATSTIMFKNGVNLIVGDQGCGKSTALAQIDFYGKAKKAKADKRKFSSDIDKCKIELLWEGPGKKFGYFDFEKYNPRTQPGFGMGYGYDIGFQVSSMWASHGETVNPLLSMLKMFKDSVTALDEPDMALSPRSIFSLIKDLKRIDEEQSGQVIMTAHNPLLIASFPEVCSLEHGRWMPSSEFLELQATEPAPKFSSKTPRKIEVVYRKKKEKAADEVVDSLLDENEA